MQYLCGGYQRSPEEIVNGALFASDNDEMVIVKDIELYSLCEHHLLPFIGKAHVACIPTGRVLGLSRWRASSTCMRGACRSVKTHSSDRRSDPEVTGAAGVAVVIEAATCA